MKKTFILALLFLPFLLIISCNKSDDIPDDILIPKPVNTKLQNIFNIDKVPQITLEISTAEWNRLLADFDINQDNEEYINANFKIIQSDSTTQLDSIGIRLRGNTSRRRPEGVSGEVHQNVSPDWHHAHFALSFKKYRKNQRYADLEKINLKWFKDDANYVREVYCYDLFERFGIWTAPQSSYCRLTIKIKEDQSVAYFGVYQMVESVDEDYLKNRLPKYSAASGNLWKCNYGANLRYADQSKMGIENITLNPDSMKTFVYDLKTNKSNLSAAKAELSDFITNYNNKIGDNFKEWLIQKVDVPFLLKTYAVNVMVGMWDDYWANSNNFYMYFDANGKFYFIPYDYDNTLGTSLLMNSGTKDLLNWGSLNNPLIKKILEFPEFKTIYVNYLYELALSGNDLFNYNRSLPRIQKWQAMIAPFVSNDTQEDMLIEDKPASWGNQSYYRLNSASDNFFLIRSANLP